MKMYLDLVKILQKV